MRMAIKITNMALCNISCVISSTGPSPPHSQRRRCYNVTERQQFWADALLRQGDDLQLNKAHSRKTIDWFETMFLRGDRVSCLQFTYSPCQFSILLSRGVCDLRKRAEKCGGRRQERRKEGKSKIGQVC